MSDPELFLASHARAHSGRLTGVEGFDAAFYEDRAVYKLEEPQLRLRPHGLNSIAWLLWHIARTEDVAANVVLASKPQVLDLEGWAGRLGVSRRDIGTGMSPEEVADLSAEVHISALRDYRLEVGRRTRTRVQVMGPDDWHRPVEEARIRQAFSEGAFLPTHSWPYAFWGGHSVADLLAWPCLGHSLMHLGQAMWVRKLVRG